MKKHRFEKYLEYYAILAEEAGNIKDIDFTVPGHLLIDMPELTLLDKVHKGIEDFYRNVADGYGFEWYANKEKGIGGNIKLANTEYLFADMQDYYYYDEEILSIHGQDLQYFQPFDYCSDESECGFIIRPDSIEESLYYKSISSFSLDYLDLF